MSVLAVLIMIVMWGYVYYRNTGNVPSLFSNKNFAENITHDLESDGYEVELFEVELRNYGEQSLVVFAQDNQYKKQCDLDKKIELKPPMMLVYEQYENPLKILFNSKYLLERKFIFSQSEGGFWLYEKKFFDLDNDHDEEIIVKLLGSVCGSGTELQQIVFDNSSGYIVPMESVPIISYIKDQLFRKNNDYIESVTENEKYRELEGFNTGQIQMNGKILNSTNTDHLVEFLDIDRENGVELIFAHPELVNGECHLCPHYWTIGVYKYREGKYYIDNKWNRGLLYKTKQKISLNEALGYAPYSGNAFGLIFPYYIDNDLLKSGYYLLERDTSKIIDIVKKNYNK